MPSSPASNATKLRRLALNKQGLTRKAPFGSGLTGSAAALRHLGYVQIDTISVVQRAHHHVLATRIPGYKTTHLNQLVDRGLAFEYWHHAAAYMPMEHYRFARLRMQDIKDGVRFWSKRRDLKLEKAILERIRSDGPLMARDFEAPGHKSNGWWEWKPAKHSLEQLFMMGDLCAPRRDGFQKVYDLPERVLPADVVTHLPSTLDYATHLMEAQLANYGHVTPKSITYLQRSAELRKESNGLFKERVAAKQLVAVELPNGESVYTTPDIWASRTPSTSQRVSILSPFDNSVIQRERVARLFGFDYQIECYVPEAKRQYGYFCLPLTFGDDLIGRMDCKAHRKEEHLEIRALYLEKPMDAAVQESFIAAFADACNAFRRFNQCASITLRSCKPKQLQAPLRAALKKLT